MIGARGGCRHVLGVLFTVLVASPVALGGTIYYISSSTGSDSNPGNRSTAPFKTLAVGLWANFNPGDQVLLKRGDVFFESVRTNGRRPGVTIGAYGNAADPLPRITGGYTVPASGWTLHKGSIWKQTLPASLGDLPDQTYAWFGTTTMLTPARTEQFSLVGGYPLSTSWINGTGRAAVDDYYVNSWVMVRAVPGLWIDRVVTGSSRDGTVQMDSPMPLYNNPGYGYFFFNDLRLLDQPGEYYLDTATRIVYVWLPDSSSPNQNAQRVTVNILPYGIHMGSHVNITFQSIRFDYQLSYGLDASSPSNVTIQGCEFYGQWEIALDSDRMATSVITRNTFANTSIAIRSGFFDSCTISYNNLTDIGLWPEYGRGQTNDGTGINVENGANTLVLGNTLQRIGFMGIRADGVNNLVTQNYVEDAMMSLNDGGGIYIGPQKAFRGTVIKDNYIVHTRCSLNAQPANTACMGHGIYLDWTCQATKLIGNTVYQAWGHAVLSNGGFGHQAKDNVLYDPFNGAALRINEVNPGENGDWEVTGNVFYLGQAGPLDNSRRTRYAVWETTKAGTPMNSGLFADNIYWSPYNNDLLFRNGYVLNGVAQNPDLSLAGWQALFPGRDAGSIVGPYHSTGATYSVVQADLVANPTMNAIPYKYGVAQPWVTTGAASKITPALVVPGLVPYELSVGAQRVCENQNCFWLDTSTSCVGEAGRLQSCHWQFATPGQWPVAGQQQFLIEFTYASALQNPLVTGLKLGVYISMATQTGPRSDWIGSFSLDPNARSVAIIVDNNSTQPAGEGRLEFSIPCGQSVVIANVRATQISNVVNTPEEAVLFVNPSDSWQAVAFPAGDVYQSLLSADTLHCNYAVLRPWSSIVLARGQNMTAGQAETCIPYDSLGSFPIMSAAPLLTQSTQFKSIRGLRGAGPASLYTV